MGLSDIAVIGTPVYDNQAQYFYEGHQRLRNCIDHNSEIWNEADSISKILDTLGEILNLYRCIYFRIDANGEALPIELEYKADNEVISLLGGTLPWHLCPWLIEAAKNKKFCYTTDTVGDSRVQALPELSDIYIQNNLRSAIVSPVVQEGRVISMIVAQHKEPYTWSSGELNITVTAADYVVLASVIASKNIYARKLQQSNKDLELFASVAAHDIRAPLRKIRIFSEQITQGELSTEHQQLLQRISQSAASLDKLTESLLALARLQEEHHSVKPVNLEKVAQNALTSLSEDIAKTGSIIKVQASCLIVGNETQLQQLFKNLIENAIKYQPDGQTPIVNIQCEVREKDVVIRVQDNGIGFNLEDIERIFQPFERLHGKSSTYEGSGIGLAICKRIVERHRGQITAEGLPNQGATFIITLPLCALG